MIQSFPLDYMDLTCLGVMRKLLLAWKKGPLTVRIGTQNVNRISERLSMIKFSVPNDFARKPRSLDELARWKATELRQFLLYTGPVVLKNIVNEDIYNHFLTFHLANSWQIFRKHMHSLSPLSRIRDRVSCTKRYA